MSVGSGCGEHEGIDAVPRDLIKPEFNGPFSGAIAFAGVDLVMRDPVAFSVGLTVRVGKVAGYRSCDDLLLVTSDSGNYAIGKPDFVGLLRPAR